MIRLDAIWLATEPMELPTQRASEITQLLPQHWVLA